MGGYFVFVEVTLHLPGPCSAGPGFAWVCYIYGNRVLQLPFRLFSLAYVGALRPLLLRAVSKRPVPCGAEYLCWH
jgi:hypothetical protein